MVCERGVQMYSFVCFAFSLSLCTSPVYVYCIMLAKVKVDLVFN